MPSLLAAVFLATSGVGGALLHLCGMEGLVRTTCCCHASEADAPPAELRDVDECCGALLANGQHPPAKLDTSDPNVEAQVTVAFAPFETGSARHGDCVRRLPAVRGPPPGVGPPLYLRHCSWLN